MVSTHQMRKEHTLHAVRGEMIGHIRAAHARLRDAIDSGIVLGDDDTVKKLREIERLLPHPSP